MAPTWWLKKKWNILFLVEKIFLIDTVLVAWCLLWMLRLWIQAYQHWRRPRVTMLFWFLNKWAHTRYQNHIVELIFKLMYSDSLQATLDQSYWTSGTNEGMLSADHPMWCATKQFVNSTGFLESPYLSWHCLSLTNYELKYMMCSQPYIVICEQ